MRRTGTADLPLHGGKAPPWLFKRMSSLAGAVVEAMTLESGTDELLRRLSDPFWFQAFGCLLGFDWHSSGVTTTVCGAIKVGVAGRERDVGLLVAGGKGAASKRTPREIASWERLPGLSATRLVYASRLSAKVDNSAVQDGFTLYHHTFFASLEGRWAVVQQGMHESNGMARRYHWLGERVLDFVDEPHAAVCGRAPGEILNFVARESADARGAATALAREKPEALLAELELANTAQLSIATSGAHLAAGGSAAQPSAAAGPARLSLPRHHAVTAGDVGQRYLKKILLKTYEEQPEDFERLLGTKGVGPRTLRALNLLSQLFYGSAAATRDPATFSFAHGGKDGTPYPVDRETYDRTIDFLSTAVSRSRAGRSDRLDALKRLQGFGRTP
jgi:hypothetical protein